MQQNKCFFHKWEEIGHYGEIVIFKCKKGEQEKEEKVSDIVRRNMFVEVTKHLFPNE